MDAPFFRSEEHGFVQDLEVQKVLFAERRLSSYHGEWPRETQQGHKNR